MGDLNSILFEGSVHDFSSSDLPDGAVVASFDIVSKRFENSNGEILPVQTRVKVHVSGKLAKACREMLAEPRSVRVVGRLANYDDAGGGSTVGIFAEHVEFKSKVADV